MKNIHLIVLMIFALSNSACKTSDKAADAYGNFEAVETIISAEGSGKLLDFKVFEGRDLEAGVLVGEVDSLQLVLKKKQLIAMKAATSSKSINILAQEKVYDEQIRTLTVEKDRVERLLKDKAATQQQLDDINGKINIAKRQIEAIKTQNSSVFSELDNYDSQISQIADQISKCKIRNPIKGTVLKKYVEQFEFVNTGKALYKVANLDSIILRVYVSELQLKSLKLGQKVQVFIDQTEKEMKKYDGYITWTSDKIEFTPKNIQTREERVSNVYAVKLGVKNDGTLHIGMPGEDGYSLIRKLRSRTRERGAELPAAALTAYARSEDRAQALQAGFNAHIAKPVDPSELVVIVARLVGRAG